MQRQEIYGLVDALPLNDTFLASVDDLKNNDNPRGIIENLIYAFCKERGYAVEG